MPPVTLAVLGAGNRGNAHGDWALANPERARVLAVDGFDVDVADTPGQRRRVRLCRQRR